MNKIMGFSCSFQRWETQLDQNTQPQNLLYTYVTIIVTVKIEQYHQSVFKGTVKDKVPFWQVFLGEMGY